MVHHFWHRTDWFFSVGATIMASYGYCRKCRLFMEQVEECRPKPISQEQFKKELDGFKKYAKTLVAWEKDKAKKKIENGENYLLEAIE